MFVLVWARVPTVCETSAAGKEVHGEDGLLLLTDQRGLLALDVQRRQSVLCHRGGDPSSGELSGNWAWEGPAGRTLAKSTSAGSRSSTTLAAASYVVWTKKRCQSSNR